MSSPRSRELMNKNSQHEFRFTNQDGLQIACTRWQNRGQVRTNILVWLSSVLHDQSRNREALWPR